MLRELGTAVWKHWDGNFREATWLVNTRGSAQTKPLCTVRGNKMLIGKRLGKAVWVAPPWGKGKPFVRLSSHKDLAVLGG